MHGQVLGRRWSGAAAAVVALAAGLRLYRLGHELPELVWVDAFKYVDEAARMVAAGSLRPHVFQYPGLLCNLLAGAYALLGPETTLGRHLIAETVVAIFATAGVLATYLLARRVCGPPAAVLAAATLALSPAALSFARIPAPDVILMLFVTLALALLLLSEPGRAHLVGAGAAIGLAVGSKFTALYLLPFVPLVLLMAPAGWHWKRAAVRTAVVMAVALVVLTLTTPFLWSELPSYGQRLLREAQIQRFGMIGRVQLGPFDYLLSATPSWETPWLSTSVAGNLGYPVLLAVIAALVAGLALRGGRAVFVLALFVTIFLVLISGPGRLKAYRFLLPVLPVLSVLVAWLVERLVSGVARRWRPWLAAALIAVLLAVPTLKAAGFVRMCHGETSNRLAAQWVEANVADGAVVFLAPFFTDHLIRDGVTWVRIPRVGSRQYSRPAELGPSPERDPIYHPAMVDQLRASGVRYVILNSYFDGAFSPVAENLRHFPVSVSAYAAFRQRLEAEAELVFEVLGVDDHRLGPDITVFEFPSSDPDPDPDDRG